METNRKRVSNFHDENQAVSSVVAAIKGYG